MRTIRRALAVGVATAAVVLQVAAPAGAAGPLLTGLAGPLGLAVGDDGTVYVSQSFSGTLTTLSKKGVRRDVAQLEGEIAGVEAAGRGSVAFVSSTAAGALLQRLLPNGAVVPLADLGAFEEANNPDASTTYGPSGSAECLEALPPDAGAPYDGVVEAHPYAVASLPDGSYVVADAAGNDLVKVSRSGATSLLSVLPPQVLPLDGFGPACAGATYAFEPVPTDVEVGPGGKLYVTTLPGGPEDPSLGARGSVYRVDPVTGASTRIGTGFAGATGLAVAPDGTVYVAEIFGGVSKLVAGGPQPFADLPLPANVEVAGGQLYVTAGTFFGPEDGGGFLVRMPLG